MVLSTRLEWRDLRPLFGEIVERWETDDEIKGGSRMTFVRYQHIVKLDAGDAKGLTDGLCHVFPKMDGSNGSVFVEEDGIRCASRNQKLDGNHPMTKWALGNPGIVSLLSDHPQLRLYGEWMVPHTIRDYTDDTWNRLLVFDVVTDTGEFHAEFDDDEGHAVLDHSGDAYLPYSVYSRLLDHYGVEYIPETATVDFPTESQLMELADTASTYRVKDEGVGEGIVVKRYGYRNLGGEEVWAKVLSSRFGAMKGYQLSRRQKTDGSVEDEIAADSVTVHLVEKEYAKIAAETGGYVHPARLLGVVWKCVIDECLWDEIRKHRNPTIDFRRLKANVERLVKTAKPELYGGIRDGDAR